MEVRGVWWLPHASQDKQAGTLSLDADQCALVLDACFANPDPNANADGIVHFTRLFDIISERVIWGESTTGDQHYSLLECTTHQAFAGVQMTGQRHVARMILSGYHATDDGVKFDVATLAYRHLLDWAAWLGLGLAKKEERNELVGTVRMGTIRRSTHETSDAIIHLDEIRPYEYDARHLTISQQARIVLQLNEPLGWQALIENYVTPLHDLVSFATLTGSAIDQIEVHPVGAPDDCMAQLSFRSVDMKRSVDVTRLHNVDMLFTLADTRQWPDVFASWFSVYPEYRRVLQQLLSTEYAPFEWAENRFLGVARAADALGGRLFRQQPFTRDEINRVVAVLQEGVESCDLRDYAIRVVRGGNYYPQRDKLRFLVENVSGVGEDVLSSAPTFIEDVKAVRDGLTHPSPAGNPGIERRFWLEQALRWVLRASLLKVLGVSEDEVTRLVRRNRNYQAAMSELARTT